MFFLWLSAFECGLEILNDSRFSNAQQRGEAA